MSATILLADDDASLRFVLSQALSREGYAVQATSSVATLSKWVQEGKGDLVLSDVYMGEASLFEVLPKMRASRRGLPIIVMSAQSTVATALSAANSDVFDYLPKPFDLDHLFALVRKALATGPGDTRAKFQSAQREERLPLIGRSAAMQDVFRTVARVASLDLPVLIIGEAGAGKQRVARTLHDHGRRAGEPFLQIPLAGASAQSLDQGFGELTSAQRGTMFLDDVDELSIEAQRRLSNWLQLDDNTQRRPRLITATRRDLAYASEQGSFLPDLYYRLSVVTIRLPPLRERREDIADLSRALLVRARREGLPEKALDTSAAALLEQYSFPGNVRELDNLLRRAAALNPGPQITASDLAAELRPPQPEINVNRALEEAMSRWTEQALSAGDEINDLHDRALRLVERPLVERALEASRGNQIKAAGLLGINRNTLRKKMQQLGLTAGRSD